MSAASATPIKIYTDGGAEPNPGTGGWAAILVSVAEETELSGGERETTNNRMEMTAAIRALESLDAGTIVEVYTDSTYLKRGVTEWMSGWRRRGWRKSDGDPVKNADLWRALDAAQRPLRVSWRWIRGHAGHEYNERADRLASEEIARRRDGGAPPRPDAAEPQTAAAVAISFRLTFARGRGAWAARVLRGDQEQAVSEVCKAASAAEVELAAALQLLEATPSGATVRFTGGSDYLHKGATSWLVSWKQRGWKTAAGDPVRHRELWRRLDAVVGSRRVQWVRLAASSAESRALAKQARALMEERGASS